MHWTVVAQIQTPQGSLCFFIQDPKFVVAFDDSFQPVSLPCKFAHQNTANKCNNVAPPTLKKNHLFILVKPPREHLCFL